MTERATILTSARCLYRAEHCALRHNAGMRNAQIAIDAEGHRVQRRFGQLVEHRRGTSPAYWSRDDPIPTTVRNARHLGKVGRGPTELPDDLDDDAFALTHRNNIK